MLPLLQSGLYTESVYDLDAENVLDRELYLTK